MKKKYRLIELHKTRNNDFFTLTLTEQSERNYGEDSRDIQEFDSEIEALEYVEKNKEWHYTDFVILPVYYYNPI